MVRDWQSHNPIRLDIHGISGSSASAKAGIERTTVISTATQQVGWKTSLAAYSDRVLRRGNETRPAGASRVRAIRRAARSQACSVDERRRAERRGVEVMYRAGVIEAAARAITSPRPDEPTQGADQPSSASRSRLVAATAPSEQCHRRSKGRDLASDSL